MERDGLERAGLAPEGLERRGQACCGACGEAPCEPAETLCGHLFCAKCLYEWACENQSKQVPCPACRAAVDVDRLIPVYVYNQQHHKKDTRLGRTGKKVSKKPKKTEQGLFGLKKLLLSSFIGLALTLSDNAFLGILRKSIFSVCSGICIVIVLRNIDEDPFRLNSQSTLKGSGEPTETFTPKLEYSNGIVRHPFIDALWDASQLVLYGLFGIGTLAIGTCAIVLRNRRARAT